MTAQDTAEQTQYNRMLQLVLAAWGSQVVRALSMLSVAEHLESEALTAPEIAERESADADMTYRLLRAAAALDILRYDPDTRRFSGTPLLRVLHPDARYTLKYFAQTSAGPIFWGLALSLPESVARGHNHVRETLGCELFEYFGQHPEQARLFSTGLADLSTPVIATGIPAIDVTGARTVVDVGGADGTFLYGLLRRHPQLTGTVLDLPHVLPAAVESAARHGLSDRVTTVAGDFFTSVPAADLYLVKHILHDWDDEACVRLLSNVRRAMNPGGRVFIVEMVMSPSAPSVNAALLDMVMLFATDGRERELDEYEALLTAAGLRPHRVTPIHAPYAVIEARAA